VAERCTYGGGAPLLAILLLAAVMTLLGYLRQSNKKVA
jgi:hypothetical protein